MDGWDYRLWRGEKRATYLFTLGTYVTGEYLELVYLAVTLFNAPLDFDGVLL